MEYKLGSLFDGSGGFPLAGCLCGITPVWASEVEPYPIAVTRSHFPDMKHLGDISKINGAEIEPVDIITFGSPCQDLSVAGKQAGLKHEDNGDDETTRSGLFMEAVRIIKEMREATDGKYPAFALWENVPGAFNSNKGADFQVVLEELIKIVEPGASVPPPPKSGWPYADIYLGSGWSLAYRTFDAQYWGVPQRRRRIHLVVDFRGERAGKVLFEREGLRGYFAEGRTPRQGIAADAQGCACADDRDEGRIRAVGFDAYNQALTGDKSKTLNSAATDTDHIPCVVYDARGNGDGKTVSTITGDHENHITDYTSVVIEQMPIFSIQGNTIDRNAKQNGNGICENVTHTLNALDRHAVAYCSGKDHEPDAVKYIVRRLTPTECARLQGFADRWGDIDEKADFTPEEFEFWVDVRNTHAKINGKKAQAYSVPQMVTWYNKLHTDSAEYKMWGNGIALPPALYCMQGIIEEMEGSDG